MLGDVPCLFTDILYYSYKGVYVFSNKGKQVKSIEPDRSWHTLVVDYEGNTQALFLDMMTNNIHTIRCFSYGGNTESATVGEIVGTIDDLTLVSKNQAIEILENNQLTVFNNKRILRANDKETKL